MSIDQLIEVLKQAKKDFGGDLPVTLKDSETGNEFPIMEVQKTHPYTGRYGCINRDEPVSGIVLLQQSSGTIWNEVLSTIRPSRMGITTSISSISK